MRVSHSTSGQSVAHTQTSKCSRYVYKLKVEANKLQNNKHAP